MVGLFGACEDFKSNVICDYLDGYLHRSQGVANKKLIRPVGG